MKGSIFGKMVLMFTMALIFAPFNAWADDKKPTYDELEYRVNELEQKLAIGPEQTDAGQGPSASADMGMFSKYMWRGFELSDDSIVIQPSIAVAYKGFSVNLWGNLDTDFADTGDSEFNETDLTLAYDTSLGDFDLGIGYIYYGLDGLEDAEEFYGSICASAIPLAPTLTIYREIAAAQGWYLNLGISHSVDLPHDMTLDLGGSVGYYYSNDDGFVEVDSNLNPTGKRYRNFHDGLVSVGLTIPLDEYFTLCPMIAYSFPLGGNADDLLTASSMSNDSDFFFGGVTLSIAF